MKLSLVFVSALAAVASVVSVVACSSSSDDAPSDAPPVQTEGGTLPPAPDADVPVEAGVDADADAGPPRVCSDDDFCHTPVPPKETLRAVWADGLGTAWAVSDSGAVLRYDGKTWSTQAKLAGALAAVWGSGPTDVWVGGEGGVFHGTGASPATLAFNAAKVPGDERAAITSIWGTGPDDIWAVGGYLDFPRVARVLHYTGAATDAGAAWSEDPVSSQPIVTTRIWGTATSGLWLGGTRLNPKTRSQQVVVLRRDVGSTEWVEIPLASDPGGFGNGGLFKLYDASVSADGTIWILGRTDTSVAAYERGTSVDNGQTYAFAFVSIGSVTQPTMNAIWGSAATDAWMAGDYGRLRHWNGTAWTQAKISITKYPDITPLYAIWGKGTTDLWVVGDGIALHRDASKKAAP